MAPCPEAAGLILRAALPWRARAAEATHRLPGTDGTPWDEPRPEGRGLCLSTRERSQGSRFLLHCSSFGGGAGCAHPLSPRRAFGALVRRGRRDSPRCLSPLAVRLTIRQPAEQ